MKIKSAISKFLTNKLVLNVIALLAFFNVIGYGYTGNHIAVIYFIVIAILTMYFSKNMTIVLGIPLIIVNLMVSRGAIMEGLTNNNKKGGHNNSKKGPDPNKNKGPEPNKNKGPEPVANKDQKNINKIVNNNKNKPDQKTHQGLAMAEVATHEDNAAQTTEGEQQGFEPGRRKNRGNDIDYATTVEDAYDDLNKILGSDGIQRLTNDTQNLMKQQMQLAEAMKGMGPIIQSIAPMVKNLQGMMGSLGNKPM